MLFSTEANPVPDGCVAGAIYTPDKVELRTARWPALGSKRLGTICLLQGRSESIEKYFETIQELRHRGFAVATFDWRGQGGSQRLLANPLKGHVASFSDYVTDLKSFMEQIVLPDCPPPYYVLAHSMGGLVAFLAEASLRNYFERMILSAPLLGLGELYEPVGFARSATGFLSALGLRKAWPPGQNTTPAETRPFAGNALTSDPVRYTRNGDILKAAPGLALGAPTIGWARAAFTAMENVLDPAFAPRVAVPVLMVAAGGDKVVSNIAIEHVAVGLRAGSRIVLPGAQHEILQERQPFREQFFAAFDAFIPGDPVYGA